MDLICASHLGFCFGVKRAIDMAIKAVNNQGIVYSLGPLIHNPQEVERLEQLGIKQIDNISQLKAGHVLIRAHGESPEVITQIKRKGLKLIDTTCPFVKKAQDRATKLLKEGYQVIIVGDRNHPEVIGIVGRTAGEAIVVESPQELANLGRLEKVGAVAQTTQSPENLQAIIIGLLPKAKELKVYNTICNATTERQKEAQQIAKKVDLMIIIGGKKSANTQRLAQICRKTGTKTYHIETAAELKAQWLKNQKRVGITAGTSTPNWVIDEVISKLKQLTNINQNG